MRSGREGSASSVYLLYSSGGNNNGSANSCYAVRPALHSIVINFEKSYGYTVLFGAVAHMYNAWLRSGLEADVDRVYRFDDIGELAVDVAFGRYAVRPASLDCDKLKKPRISRTFGVIARIYNAWVRSGAYNNALDVYYLVASGGRNSDYGTRRYAVRPASLDCDKLKKPRISRTFGVIARIYNAWLRSGNRDYAYNVRLLNSSGAPVYRDTDRRFAVRPASLDCDKFEKSLISRTFGSIARIYNAWVRSGFSEESYGCLSIAASGSRNYAYAIRYFAVRPAPTRLRKIYCRQFPNSVRISTAEQISYEMKGAIAPLAPHKYGNGKTYSTLI